MEALIVAVVLALAGWRLYAHGKSTGSRQSYGVGYRHGRRGRRNPGDGRRR